MLCLVLHSAAVIRIHQSEFPEFVALINIRNTWGRELDQGLREAVQHSKVGRFALEWQEAVPELFGFQNRFHKMRHGQFVVLIWICPIRVLLRLSNGFAHEVADALNTILSCASVSHTEPPAASDHFTK